MNCNLRHFLMYPIDKKNLLFILLLWPENIKKKRDEKR